MHLKIVGCGLRPRSQGSTRRLRSGWERRRCARPWRRSAPRAALRPRSQASPTRSTISRCTPSKWVHHVFVKGMITPSGSVQEIGVARGAWGRGAMSGAAGRSGYPGVETPAPGRAGPVGAGPREWRIRGAGAGPGGGGRAGAGSARRRPTGRSDAARAASLRAVPPRRSSACRPPWCAPGPRLCSCSRPPLSRWGSAGP